MTGFFGKLPGKGDFLSRGLPRSFVDPWDSWLGESMEASRQALGDAWLQTYLTSPLWRFVLPPGTLGSEAWAGVLMPSVDKVGRYFPMTVATSVPASGGLLLTALGGGHWYDAVEQLLLAALDDEALEIETFDAALRELPLPAAESVPVVSPQAIDRGMRLPLDADASVAQLCARLSMQHLEATLGACCLWFGQGSELVAPSLVLSRGLPGQTRFTALLDGQWQTHGWSEGNDAGAEPGNADAPVPTILDLEQL